MRHTTGVQMHVRNASFVGKWQLLNRLAKLVVGRMRLHNGFHLAVLSPIVAKHPLVRMGGMGNTSTAYSLDR